VSMGTDGQPTILLIESDDDTRPILKENLERDGYRVIVALDEEDAMGRVADGHARADLLLYNVVGVRPVEAMESARRIHRNAGFDNSMPIVAMAEKYGPEMEGKNVAVSEHEYIVYLEDAEQLHNLIARLLNK
jgi:DNA-binding response OmpR family regulator